MLRINCPCCGVLADETELHCDGQAHIKWQGTGSSDLEFETYLFARSNPLGVHFERWRHVYGCGKWFHVARCTLTMQVFGVYSAQTHAPPRALLNKIKKQRPDFQGYTA